MKNLYYIKFLVLAVILMGCSSSDDQDMMSDDPITTLPTEPNYVLPNIDLNNWKVTLPVGNPTEVEPPEILDYATNPVLKPFMYNDSINGALVFYTYPGATTTNTSYSRTELREQMVPGSNATNWTFAEGGNMKATIQMGNVSKDDRDRYHRTIVLQIHGRLTNDQRDLIGEDDNNAPPILKIYWTYGKVRVKSKILKDLNATYEESLHTDAWDDDEGYTFPEVVGFEKFNVEVDVNSERIIVKLNNDTYTIQNESIERWGVFENYFKAGNYLASTDSNAFATVKFYDLEVAHE